MKTVFISYKREDRERVQRLQGALEAAGMATWWDSSIAGGEQWSERIEDELNAAGCVIVVWTVNAIGEKGTFVRDEARRGLARGVLLPVRLDNVEPPIGFGEIQTLDLVGWSGHDLSDPRVVDVVATAKAIVERRPRPKLLWRARQLRSFASRSTVLALTLAGASAGLYGFRDRLCAEAGLTWACGDATCLKWVPALKRQQLYVRMSEDWRSSRAEAESDAAERARNEAGGAACAFLESDLRKVLAGQLDARGVKYQCLAGADGYRCAAEGEALCKVSERRTLSGVACAGSAR